MVKGFLLGLKVVTEKLGAEVDPSEGSGEQAELQSYFGNFSVDLREETYVRNRFFALVVPKG